MVFDYTIKCIKLRLKTEFDCFTNNFVIYNTMNDLLCNIRTTQVLDDGDTNTQHSLEPSQVFIANVHKQKPHVLKHTSLSVKNSSYLYSVNKY